MALDIGNSGIKVGLFKNGSALTRVGRIELSRQIDKAQCINLLNEFLKSDKPSGAVLSSVVPEVTNIVKEAVEAVIGQTPLFLTHETDSGLKLDIADPSTMGADRIAGALGAVHTIGTPVAVVDLGTATTVGFAIEAGIPESAVFKGGTIMPGLTLMARALMEGTAQLPEVDLQKPFNAIGRDTRENILSGIVLGTAGAIERIIAEAERTEGLGFQVVLTGGHADVVKAHMSRPPVLLEPNLTLLGLRAVHERVSQL